MCAHWVGKGATRSAVGLDTDAAVLSWAKQHNIAPLGAAAERVSLLKRDVLKATGQHYDVTLALNFSYCIFVQRREMLRYCRGVLGELANGGVLMMDIHGGSDLTIEVEQEIEHEGFTYRWQQQPFDAINGTSTRYIHFEFPDGSKLDRAFTYHWRLWSLQELRDILEEAGFSAIDVYWEGANEDGGGNGRFKKTQRADQEQSWIAYIAAWK